MERTGAMHEFKGLVGNEGVEKNFPLQHNLGFRFRLRRECGVKKTVKATGSCS